MGPDPLSDIHAVAAGRQSRLRFFRGKTSWPKVPEAGVLVGSTPDQACFVRCNAPTTTQSEISSGQVNGIVGFAPCFPDKFVLLVIGLIAGG
jgi:hypothetical protein